MWYYAEFNVSFGICRNVQAFSQGVLQIKSLHEQLAGTLPKVQHDIIDEKFQWPGLTETDQKELLYGAEETLFFEGQKWGGMSADPGIYLQ